MGCFFVVVVVIISSPETLMEWESCSLSAISPLHALHHLSALHPSLSSSPLSGSSCSLSHHFEFPAFLSSSSLSLGNFAWCSLTTFPPFTASPIHSLPLSLTLTICLAPPSIHSRHLSHLSPAPSLFFLYLVLCPRPANGAWDWLINGCLSALRRQLGYLVRVERREERLKKKWEEEWGAYHYIYRTTLF